ncbi:unnamed protein product [Clonostachys rhizophaga]|uniref:Uncharacterized protein n=1 Tax=Clonostachys rhizophaga TaxID=160324 RepID=A0A9N9W220_9HYPO|nr:unnamed protein product [Clonostachys rhizophaga]
MKETVFHHLLYSAEDIFLWIHIVIRELRNIQYVSRESVQNILNETPQELVLEAAVTGMHTSSNSLAACSENKSFFDDESIRAHFGASIDVIDDTVS